MTRRDILGEFGIDREVIEKEIDALLNENITLKCGVALGRDIDIDGLMESGYGAVLLAIGAHKSKPLRLENEDVEGVYPSIEFLKAFNLQEQQLAKGKVGVIGGGNSAIDAARMAMRLNAVDEVTILYRRTRDEMPAFAEEVIDLGYLPEQDKHDAYAAATLFVQPSAVESFSIVLMEAWLQGTAALINGECEVMRQHCQRSEAGLPFEGYHEFEAALDHLLARPALRSEMGLRGEAYVRQNYRWEDVVERFVAAVYGEMSPECGE